MNVLSSKKIKYKYKAARKFVNDLTNEMFSFAYTTREYDGYLLIKTV